MLGAHEPEGRYIYIYIIYIYRQTDRYLQVLRANEPEGYHGAVCAAQADGVKEEGGVELAQHTARRAEGPGGGDELIRLVRIAASA